MILLIIFAIIIIYYRGFRIVNYFRDYFLVGEARENYVVQEIRFMQINQKLDKEVEEIKSKIAQKYKQKLSDQDNQISNQILKLRLDNVYKKYNIINLSNTELLSYCEEYVKTMIMQNYNQCLSLVIQIMQVKKTSNNK